MTKGCHKSRRCPAFTLILSLLATIASRTIQPAWAAQPLRLHPDNPHYFLWRGSPTILITSGEHYGALLNSDFDYKTYLKTLQSHGFNLTRTFSGAYCENPGAFKIQNNTLAPAPGRLICPWARSETAGYAGGGNKFDLTRWDPAYFERLRNFLTEAGQCGVVVEFVLFCPFYEEAMWALSPMNAANNVNGIGNVKRNEVYLLQDARLTDLHDAMVRKIVEELNGFDNLYYEICNEPYERRTSDDWQVHIAETIVKTEAGLPNKHLIDQNIANRSKKIENPNPLVSIFNFHYAVPPDAVTINYHLNRVIGDNETGFRGSDPKPYRIEGWDFLIAGGGLYNNLDYSFTVGHEDGTAPINAPGGGGPVLRKQLEFLKSFIYGFDFVKMRPDNSVIVGGVPEKVTARALVEPGRALAIYVNGNGPLDLKVKLPAGRVRIDWMDTKEGRIDKTESYINDGGVRNLKSPVYQDDIALRIALMP